MSEEKQDVLTFKKLEEIAERIRAAPCPIKDMLTEHGFNHEDGDYLLLPESMRLKMFDSFGHPPYVKFSKWVAGAFLVKGINGVKKEAFDHRFLHPFSSSSSIINTKIVA